VRKKVKAVIGGAIAAVLVGGTATAVLVSRQAATRVPAAKAAQVNSATVTRTSLAETETLPGTLGFGPGVTINRTGSGIITRLPAIGSVVSRGQALYRVNDQPVVVLYGATPLFRTLAAPKTITTPPPVTPTPTLAPTATTTPTMAPATTTPTSTGTPGHKPTMTPTVTTSATSGTPPRSPGLIPATALAALTSATATVLTGHDVTVVAQNLAAMGYDIGVQPPTASGEDSYTPALAAAVKSWQRKVGMSPTGTLGVGQVVVVSGPVRVSAVTAQLGDPVDGQLLTVSSTAKAATVSAAATDLTSVVKGASASITLPDGTQVPGTVSAIGQTVQSSQNPDTGQSATDTYNITVTPRHQAQVASLQSAPVQVTFTTTTLRNVLAVPVNALLALAGGGFALQQGNGTLIAVHTGLFANGLVQVTGAGLHAGLKVRTA
jgi:hypothetical protein